MVFWRIYWYFPFTLTYISIGGHLVSHSAASKLESVWAGRQATQADANNESVNIRKLRDYKKRLLLKKKDVQKKISFKYRELKHIYF